MCGRFTLALDAQAIKELLKAEKWDGNEEYSPSYNIAPGQLPPVLLREGKRVLRNMEWGIPGNQYFNKSGSGGKAIINIRKETLRDRHTFTKIFESRRCVVPATGYYEWKNRTHPYYFKPQSGKLMLFAGLWFTANYLPGRADHCFFSIITCAAAKEINEIHDRMPVIIPDSKLDQWLKVDKTPPITAMEIIGKNIKKLDFHPVGTMVNQVKNDSSANIEPIQQFQQPDLF